jgi:hypothetical protein
MSFLAARAPLGAALLVGSLIGIGVHCSTLYTTTLRGAPPPALDALLALLVGVAAAESLLYTNCARAYAPVARGRTAFLCRVWSAAGAAVITAASAVLFAVGYRLDAFAWCAALAAAFALVAASAAAAGDGEDKGREVVYAPLNGVLDDVEESALDALPRGARCVRASRACCCAPPGTPRVGAALFVARGAVWSALVLTSALLVGGAATVAVGWRRFPPRGALYSVPAGGGTVRMHAWCVGERGARPTVFLDVGGGGHSSSDVYGLADALAARGRRVCTADPPGTGWTRLGSAAADAVDDAPWALPILAQLGEAPPFTLVGTMDGGAARIYAAALAAPDAVAALVPMQYGPPEMATYAAFKGLDAAAAAAYARTTLAGRLGLCDLYRSLAVGWGLIGAFIPPAPAGYKGDFAAKNFLNLEHEGQWDAQCRMLAAQVRDPASTLGPDIWTANRSLPPRVRVLALANTPADPCAGGLAGDGCAFAKYAVAAAADFMRAMATMTPGSNFTDCGGACDGWLGDGTNVEWVVGEMARWGA